MSNKIILAGNERLLMPIITQLMAMHQLLEQKDIGTIYQAPADGVEVIRVRKPQIQLCFLEDSNFNKKAAPNNIEEGRRRVEGLITFRLMNETTDSISIGNLKGIANKIKLVFAANGGYVWEKGKEMYAYTDWDLGYQLQLLCQTKTTAKELVTRVLSLQNHTPNWTYFTTNENDNALARYPETPPTKIILGESVKVPRQRPRVDVRFQYAVAHIHQLKEPVALCDRGRKLISPLAD